MAPLPSLVLPSRAEMIKTDMKHQTAKNQRLSVNVGLGLSQVVTVLGFNTPGDGGKADYINVASDPGDGSGFQSRCGQWWKMIKAHPVVAGAFGVIPGNSAADNMTAITNLMTYMNASGGRDLKFLPGTTQINGTIGFAKGNWRLDLTGTTLVQNATDDGAGGEIAAIETNTGALPNESVITTDMEIIGGKILHATAYATTANKCIGVLVRGNVHVNLKGLRVEDHHRGIVWNIRDGGSVTGCHFVKNGRHFMVEEYQTTVPGNPQNSWINRNNFALNYDGGMVFEGISNMMTISENYFLGSRAIKAENGVTGQNGIGLTIEQNDFEQGAIVEMTGTWTIGTGSTTITASGGAANDEVVAGDLIETAAANTYEISSVTDNDTIVLVDTPAANETDTIWRADPYIDIRKTNAKTLYNLNIIENTFSGFSGPTTAAYVVQGRSVVGFNFDNNTVNNGAKDGHWLWLDSACKEVRISYPNFFGASWGNWPAIGYTCARKEITVFPDMVHFANDGGILSGWNPKTLSSGNDTLDMSSLLGSNYPGICQPIGYTLKAQVSDSDSLNGPAVFSVIPSTSTTSGDRWQHLYTDYAGVANDQPVDIEAFVPTDDGDLAYHVEASGNDTTSVRLKGVIIHMGGGR